MSIKASPLLFPLTKGQYFGNTPQSPKRYSHLTPSQLESMAKRITLDQANDALNEREALLQDEANAYTVFEYNMALDVFNAVKEKEQKH